MGLNNIKYLLYINNLGQHELNACPACKHVHVMKTSLHPHSCSKTGVYKGQQTQHTCNSLIFALKHRLWVLGRTASVRRF